MSTIDDLRRHADIRIADWTERTEGLCEADSFATHQFWERWSTEAVEVLPRLHIADVHDTKHRVEWRQLNPGRMPTIGRVGDMPVTVTLMWAEVDGAIVCFWASESMVTDYRIVRSFLDRTFPRAARSDAQNFHNLLSSMRWNRKQPPRPRYVGAPMMRWANIAPGRPWAPISAASPSR